MSTATELLRRTLRHLEWCDEECCDEPLEEAIRAFLAAEEQYDALRERYVEGLGNSMKDCKESFEREAERVKELLAAEPEAEPVKFLCDATRFKVTGSKAEGMIYGLPQNLIGKWVAFVDADNGQHLKYTKPEPSRKPMKEEEIIQGVTVDTSDDFHAGYWAGIRFAEKHHGIGGDDGEHK